MHLALLTSVLYLTLVSACRKDPPPTVPCPAITTSETEQSVTCVRDKMEVNCSLPSQPGTVATSSCRTGYYTPGKHTPTTATCRGDGTWSNTDLTCVKLECGRQDIVKTVIGGEEVQEGELPWNVNILSRWGDHYSVISLGNLITPTLVLTSANWVTKIAPASLKIEARKHVRRFGNDPVEPNAQERGVKMVIAHEEFGGYGGDHDIAILVANQSFVLNGAVNVACLDWSGMFNEPNADYNLMAAAGTWGKNGEDTHLYAPQRYRWMESESCNASVPAEDQKYVHQDGFCGETIGEVTCDDRHGSGLVARDDTTKSYYLLGVQSVRIFGISNVVCRSSRIIAFTNVTVHLPWIRQQMELHEDI